MTSNVWYASLQFLVCTYGRLMHSFSVEGLNKLQPGGALVVGLHTYNTTDISLAALHGQRMTGRVVYALMHRPFMYAQPWLVWLGLVPGAAPPLESLPVTAPDHYLTPHMFIAQGSGRLPSICSAAGASWRVFLEVRRSSSCIARKTGNTHTRCIGVRTVGRREWALQKCVLLCAYAQMCLPQWSIC